jgi:WD40 repeat protein
MPRARAAGTRGGFLARRAGASGARRARSQRRARAGHSKWVTSVAWEPAHAALPCRRLASGSKDCAVRVWDARTRRCLFSMGSHTKAVSCVRWAGDGHIISSARDCAIFVWDAQARAPGPARPRKKFSTATAHMSHWPMS